jgi:heme/copper-type cytochrome/quinol oxidase subunit 1
MGAYVFIGVLILILGVFVYVYLKRKKDNEKIVDGTTPEIGDEWKTSEEPSKEELNKYDELFLPDSDIIQETKDVPTIKIQEKKVYIDKTLDEIKQASIIETKKVIKKVSEVKSTKKSTGAKKPTGQKKTTKPKNIK